MSSPKAALSSLRSRIRVDRQEAMRSGSAYAAAGVIGLMEAGGQMDRLPDAFGLPKTVTLAILGKVGGSYASGDIAAGLNGLGDAAAIIAIRDFARGMTVSGANDYGREGARRRRITAADLERRLADRLAPDELADVLAALATEDD